MRTKIAAATLTVGLLLVAGGMATASPGVTGTILYGGVGGDTPTNSDNIGALVIVNQTTAALTLVGTPVPGIRISGVAFDSTGALFGSTIGIGTPPLTSTLIRIDPNTGALISTVGPITDGPGGLAISIADLTVQPGTDVLYGVRAPADTHGGFGKLYAIDKTTAVATFIGNSPVRRDSIAFAPGGTLYEVSYFPGPPFLYTLNPATGAPLTSIAVAEFYGALASRPTDSVLFVGNGDLGQIFNLNPTTGVATLLGNTSPTFVGGLAFRTCAITIGGVAADPPLLCPSNHESDHKSDHKSDHESDHGSGSGSDHGLVPVTINYTATDSCGTAAPVTCVLSVTSNEGDSSDFSVVDANHVLLRAKSDNHGDGHGDGHGDQGRIYTVTITCTDTAGSSSTAAVTVPVAHDGGHDCQGDGGHGD